MGDWIRGMLLVIFIVCLAGAIAYVGDRVGHQVGRKRLSLFGIRPRYTSTIVAIGTGMLIALVVTVGALIASQSVKLAFFHLNEVNRRVTQLQAQADELRNHVRQQSVLVPIGELMNDKWIVLPQNASLQVRYDMISKFYRQSNDVINRTYVRRGGLRPNSTPPDQVEKNLRAFIEDFRLTALLQQGPVLLLAAADQNLFPNDEVHFEIKPYPDELAFAKGQTVASILVQGGPATDLGLELIRLRDSVTQSAVTNAIPIPIQFARNVGPDLPPEQGIAMQAALRRGTGTYELVARARENVFPDMGVVPVVVSVIKR